MFYRVVKDGGDDEARDGGDRKRRKRSRGRMLTPSISVQSGSDDDYADGEDEDEVVSARKPIVTPKRQRPVVNVARTIGSNRSPPDRFNANPVVVVDYDMTLVDKNAKPFPDSPDFIRRIKQINGGRVTVVLYSHANSEHINYGLDRYYADVKNNFDEIIADHSARNNKPITHVRRVIPDMSRLNGPYAIIDDLRSNLDNDQYDIVIDVNRYTSYNKNTAVSVDYDGVMCMLLNGIKTFLSTKIPAPFTAAGSKSSARR